MALREAQSGAERRDRPAVAVGEGEDVMLVVFQTRHAACSGSGRRVNDITGSRDPAPGQDAGEERGSPWPMLWTPMDMPRNFDLVQMWALNWIVLFKHSA